MTASYLNGMRWITYLYMITKDLNLSNPEITFMHGNSIEVDFDNNLLLSNRTSNEVFKIDRLTN